MENWSGKIEQHIADTNYGLLIWDLIENQECIILATDLDGDRLTDLLADISDPLRAFGQKVLNHVNSDITIDNAWKSMGFSTGNGRDMRSVMYRMKKTKTNNKAAQEICFGKLVEKKKKNMHAKNNIPITREVIPVFPPALTPAPDST